MTRRARITPEAVRTVKNYLSDAKYENLTLVEISTLSGVSTATVTRIKNGEYDDLLTVNTEEKEESVSTIIPLDDLKRLVACEYVVNAILRQCELSDRYDNTLFIHSNVIHGVLKAYLPEEVENRLETLKREEV